MTDPTIENQPRRSWRTAAHLLVFGLLLSLIALLAMGPPVDREDGGRIVFSEADLAHVAASFERTWSRPPTAVELRRMFDRYVRDEVLYREALAMGLDRNDPVVKASLVRKITMLGSAQAGAEEPTDEEVKAYFELRTERYRIPASFDLVQVYVSPDKHGDLAGMVAADLLEELRENEPRPEELVRMGDMSMLPASVKDTPEDELARVFGSEFGDAVNVLSVGQWEGPVESSYGLHLVKISRREESRIPEWIEVKRDIVTDMQFEARKAAEDQLYAEVLPRYQVVFSDGIREILESADAQGNAAP